MSNERNKNGIIFGLLITIIVILSALVVLFATGTISFNVKETDNSKNENNIGENKDLNNTNNSEVKDKFKIENNEVTEKELGEALSLLGLYEYYYNQSSALPNDYNECLNNYISQKDFRKNSKEIFAFYSLEHELGTKTGQTEIIVDVDSDGTADIAACGGAADCGSIKINDANKIIKLYGLTGMDEYLSEMPEPYKNSEYLINYFTLTNMHPIMCNFKTNHNINIKYDNENNIIVNDKQNVTEYGFFEESEQIKMQKERDVTYTLKKDATGNYYLFDVEVQ